MGIFHVHCLDLNHVYLLAGDETVVSKAGKHTHGVGLSFSSLYDQPIRGLSFFCSTSVSGSRMEPGSTSMMNSTAASAFFKTDKRVHLKWLSIVKSVKTAAIIDEAVGFDSGKKIKGRKRFAVVDIAVATLVRTFLVPREAGDQKRPCPNQSVYGYTLGLVLRVWVGSAKIPERTGAKTALKRVKALGK